MFDSACKPALFALALALASCGEPAEYRFGENVTGLVFTVTDPDMGIHPSKAVLSDPKNPFRNQNVGADTKWKIVAEGGSVAGFYAFASVLAREPSGEAQYYAAKGLQEIAATGSVTDRKVAEVNAMAIRAYQSVLDQFPDSVSYDATGTFSFRLATPALLGIISLGGKVNGGWVLVTTPSGGQEAVRPSSGPTGSAP